MQTTKTMQELQTSVSDWGNKTFGSGQRFHPIIDKLREEIEELDDSDGDLEEFADCFILLLGAAAKKGFNVKTIEAAIHWKHNINIRRKWGKPSATGKVNHIKE